MKDKIIAELKKLPATSISLARKADGDLVWVFTGPHIIVGGSPLPHYEYRGCPETLDLNPQITALEHFALANGGGKLLPLWGVVAVGMDNGRPAHLLYGEATRHRPILRSVIGDLTIPDYYPKDT